MIRPGPSFFSKLFPSRLPVGAFMTLGFGLYTLASFELSISKLNLPPAPNSSAQRRQHFHVLHPGLDATKRNGRVQIRPGHRNFSFQTADQLLERRPQRLLERRPTILRERLLCDEDRNQFFLRYWHHRKLPNRLGKIIAIPLGFILQRQPPDIPHKVQVPLNGSRRFFPFSR